MKKYGKFVNIHIAIINRKKYLYVFIDKTCIQNIQIYCFWLISLRICDLIDVFNQESFLNIEIVCIKNNYVS